MTELQLNIINLRNQGHDYQSISQITGQTAIACQNVYNRYHKAAVNPLFLALNSICPDDALRLYNALLRAGINTISDLHFLHNRGVEFASIKGVGAQFAETLHALLNSDG